MFPSQAISQKNMEAWQSFWSKERLAKLKRDMAAVARGNGFAPSAFDPFWKIINNKNLHFEEIPEKYYEFFGITKGPAGYTQLSLITTGKNYDAEDLTSRLTGQGLAKIFDVGLFNKRLGSFLKSIFFQIALITGIGIIIIVFAFYLDWLLSLAVLAPITFALVATLGTLKIIGHPLDIPGIMLWIVIMGMGINYSIYYACFYQRYRDENHPAMDIVRLAMFLASFTTLIGFGVLAIAKHNLLRSIGITSLLGIGYSIMGAYLILPVLVKKIYAPFDFPSEPLETGSRQHLKRTLLRYRHLEAYPRVFARMKMMIDPMFKELDKYVKNPRRILDIGCGYGVPATWLLEIYPQAEVYGLEPDEIRVLIASYAIGNRGRVEAGRAPDLPDVDGDVDYVLMLDMLHLISDQEVQIAFQRIYQKLEAGGTLLVRATIPSDKRNPWKRWIEVARLKITRAPNRFRGEEEIVDFMKKAGFDVNVSASDTKGIEEKWFVGKKK
jgi:SAM-dependent methyltransferase